MMRKLILMVVVGLICGGVWARGPFVIAKRGEARVVVSLEGEAGPSVVYAGEELVKYLSEMTGGKFRLVKNAPRGEAAIRVGGPCKETKLESIEIYVKDERTMVVTGEGRRGVLYAVYRLLEHFGCGFWAPRNETVPKKGDLVVAANFRMVDAPVMEYRQPFGESAIYNPEWCVKIGVNGDMWAKPLGEKLGGHVQMDMAQSMAELKGYGRDAKNFTEHPEWFALRGGKRTNRQLCAQNEGCRAEILRRAREMMKEDPERDFISISLDDNDQVCQCEKCAKLVAEEGAIALALEPANFVARELAAEYPKLRILVLAYWITEKPPKKKMKVEKNVGIVFARLDRNYVGGLSASPTAYANLKRWGKIAGGRVWVWDYDARFHAFPTSLPNIMMLMSGFRDLRDGGARGVFSQLPQGAFGDFVDLRCWLFGKGTWNPDQDGGKLVAQWVEGACGAGAGKVKAWLALLEKARAASKGIGVYGQDSRVIVPPEIVIEGKKLMDEALELVRGDERCERQVQVLRAAPLVMMLTRYYLDMVATAKEMNVRLPARVEIYKELERMGREFGNGSYGEGCNWRSFRLRIRHGETILQGPEGRFDPKPWTFWNPVEGVEDVSPSVVYDEATGNYCWARVRNEQIEIVSAKSVMGLFEKGAAVTVAWKGEAKCPVRTAIRGVRLVKGVDGKWRIYASGMDVSGLRLEDEEEDVEARQLFVLEATGRGVVGAYRFAGLLLKGVDAADPAVATFPNGKMYFACIRRQGAAHERGLWIYELSRGTKLSAGRAHLVKAGRDGGCPQAPAFLVRGGKVFLTYTAVTDEHDSQIKVLTLEEGSALMATAWKAAKVPLLVGGALVSGKGNDRRIEGVRNLSFFTTAASNETWCVYQGVKSKKELVVDKNMLTCLQRIEFCEDGMLELDMRPEVNIELLQPDVAAVISAKAGKKKTR